MLDDKDEKIAELEAKLLELSEFVEETGVALEDFEQNAMMEKANMFSVDQNSPPFQVHWVKPEETKSFSNCDDITSVKDAQKAFKEAAEHRDESVKRVLHGDVLFLLCNKAPEPVPDPADPSNTPERGVCYFIGMCVKISPVQMIKDPDSTYDELTETILTDAGEPNREFFAWSSCGGGGEALECDRNEEYVTVVTASKVEVASTGTNPKIHTIQGFEKTRELQFDDCGTLVSVGTETAWTAVGASHQINECCDSGSGGGSGGGSTQTECVRDGWAATVQIETLRADGTQFDMSTATLNVDFCHYRRNSQPVLSKTAGVWTFSSPFGHGDFTNHTLTGNYTAPAGSTMSVTVS